MRFRCSPIASTRRVTTLVGCLAMTAGCNSRPSAIQPVDVDGASAAAEAMGKVDSDADAAFSDAELAAIPGILKHKAKYDLDGDGKVSQQEIADRIDLWATQGLGLKSLAVEVTLDGRPLSGASVKFVPEPFLGDAPKEATGVTDGNGATKIGIANEHLPESLQQARLRGLYGGLYKIEVTHPDRPLPAKYNTATTLGEEIAKDTTPDRLSLKLTSR